MKPDEENGHVQNIGEWVLDEDKIVGRPRESVSVSSRTIIFLFVLQVTYKWLSKTLSVHINTAKQ